VVCVAGVVPFFLLKGLVSGVDVAFFGLVSNH